MAGLPAGDGDSGRGSRTRGGIVCGCDASAPSAWNATLAHRHDEPDLVSARVARMWLLRGASAKNARNNGRMM